MTNTEIPATIISDALDCVHSPISIYAEYPGRGMRGSTCFGIVVEEQGAVDEFMWHLSAVVTRAEMTADELGVEMEFDPYDLQRMATSASRDNMGMGMIVYFPGYVLDGTTGYEDAESDY